MVTLLEVTTGFTIFPASNLNELIQMHFSLLGCPQQSFIEQSPSRDEYFQLMDGAWQFKNKINVKEKMPKAQTLNELFNYLKDEIMTKNDIDTEYFYESSCLDSLKEFIETVMQIDFR